jgi:hypothetical protein
MDTLNAHGYAAFADRHSLVPTDDADVFFLHISLKSGISNVPNWAHFGEVPAGR